MHLWLVAELTVRAPTPDFRADAAVPDIAVDVVKANPGGVNRRASQPRRLWRKT